MNSFKISRRKSLSYLGTMLGAAGLFPMGLSAQAFKEEINSSLFQEKDFAIGDLLYENSFSSPKDVKDFRLEGQAAITFPRGRMRMENTDPASEGKYAHFAHWCPKDFPANIVVSWDFYPVKEPGLCILFFGAKGRNGEDIFDPSLKERDGIFSEYHHGDINTYHISYFRRRNPEPRAFHVCNLRKNYGKHLVMQGPDPMPTVEDALPPYRIQLAKLGNNIWFSINDMPIFHWIDDGETYGPVLGGGKIGFRQMAPLVAEYANLTVHKAETV